MKTPDNAGLILEPLNVESKFFQNAKPAYLKTKS